MIAGSAGGVMRMTAKRDVMAWMFDYLGSTGTPRWLHRGVPVRRPRDRIALTQEGERGVASAASVAPSSRRRRACTGWHGHRRQERTHGSRCR